MAANTTFVSGNILTAAQMNALPFGQIGVVRKNSNYALTAVDTLIPTMTVTFTAIAGRIYKAQFRGLITKSTAAGDTVVSINTTVGATTTTIGSSVVYSPTSTATMNHDLTVMLVGLAAGSTTVFASAAYVVNGGTLTGSATNQMLFYVEDVGQA